MDWNCKAIFISVICLVCIRGADCFLTENIRPVEAERERIPLNRVKRSEPIIYDIYTLDHFIELVEKIERNTTTNRDTLKKVANYIRLLGYDTDLFNILCGQADPLPGTVLISEEKRILRQMVTYELDELTNQEKGVVFTTDRETIAMGRVATGICAGLVRDNSVSLQTWAPGSPYVVDNLFAATIAYDLTISALFSKNAGKTTFFGPSGMWSPDNDCPARYRLSDPDITKATNALILGGIDGFLLGHGLPSWENKGVRLGQLLRMYYGSGILYDTSYARCRRNSKFTDVVNKEVLVDQIRGLAYGLYNKLSPQLTNVRLTDIAGLARDAGQQFFSYFEGISGNTTCSTDEDKGDCEIPANIVFVMDESDSIRNRDYVKEKNFVSQIIESFDISPRQARVAIVEYSSSASLSVGFNNYGSKTRLMCAVKNLQYSGGWTHTAEAIEVTQYNVLRPALNNPVGDTETVQIVIVLTDGKSNGPKSLKQTVENLKNDIKDLTVIAIGVGSYDLRELNLIATDPDTHVFTAQNFDELINLVTSLRRKTCTAPVYMDLNFTISEDDTEVVAFVSPNKARFFTVSAEHFFGVEQIFIDVVPQYGTVTVYASRLTETPGPDNYTQRVGPAGEGESMQVEFSDLCAGYNSSDSCPSIHIGIYGESSSLTCSERDCNLPNQIKFKIRRGKPLAKSDGVRTGLHVFVQLALFAMACLLS